MRLRQLTEDGRIVKGVTTTVDVGPTEIPKQAKKWGLKVVADLPGVGENLQDHLDVLSHYECTQPVTEAKYTAGGLAVFRMAAILAQWMITKKGPGNDIGLSGVSFLKTDDTLDLPDIQMHFIGSLLKDHGKTRPDSHAFSNHVCMLRPESRGYIALKSLDPTVPPIIQPNYFATQKDHCCHLNYKFYKVFITNHDFISV